MKTIDQRSEDYTSRVYLSPGTYKGDVETAYSIACTEQTDFHLAELAKEIKLIEIDILDSPNTAIEYREDLRRRIEGLQIAIEVISQFPNSELTYHAKRYSGSCGCAHCQCEKK